MATREARRTVAAPGKPPLWGSARLSYTICAFLAMVVQLLLRNTLNFTIFCMVKHQAKRNYAIPIYDSNNFCSQGYNVTSEHVYKRTGDLLWTRSEEFRLLGAFYYGYLITLPIAGRFADKFASKILFVISLTLQAVVYMLIPVFARISYNSALIVRAVQGLVAGCGNPAIYQLFSTWAHTTERTSFMSFAYGGYSVGTLISFPLSSFLCKFGWEMVYYFIGGVSLLYGISCYWLVYGKLEDHPRLSREEYEYLKRNQLEKSTAPVPWKSIFTSVSVYAFIITHVFHNYGIIVLSQMLPRYFKEVMQFPLKEVGLVSGAPFLGAFISKGITIFASRSIEKIPNINLSKYRRYMYITCNLITTTFMFFMLMSTCHNRYIVVCYTVIMGITTDMAFSGGYWPSLLHVSPSYSGLIMGVANCLGTASGFLAPLAISNVVQYGFIHEWNDVLLSVMGAYSCGALSFGLFGSSKRASWDKNENDQENIRDRNIQESRL